MPDLNSPNGPQGIYILPKADTSVAFRCQPDLAYGHDSVFQKLDLYWPEPRFVTRPGPLPVLISVHGGAWCMGDKNDRALEPALKGLARGYAVASVNYRLSQEARFPGPVDDLLAAVGWLASHAATYDLDASRLFLWGESAGAHLAAHAALRGPCRAAALWYCPTDFAKFDPYLAESGYPTPDHSLPDSPESRLLGAQVPEVPHLVAQANPETWISATAPPVLLQHGTADDIVPWQLSRDFAAKLTQAGAEVVLEYLQGAGHATDDFRTPANVSRVLDWFDQWRSV